MIPDTPAPVSVVHRLLFQALLEIREQGHESRNNVVFHLADLFHNVVLDMEAASKGEQSFDSVLEALMRTAEQKGMETWLAAALASLDKHPVPSEAVA